MLHALPGISTRVLSAALLLLAASLGQAQTLSIDDVTVTEGDVGSVAATFTVSLSQPAGAGGVTFDVATADGTAQSGSDYIANSQTKQIIAAGSATASFAVLVNGDGVFEGVQNYFVNVGNVTGATVADAQGVGTIADNEPVPVATFALAGSAANEGASGISTPMIVAVALPGPSEVELQFNYATADVTATAGVDYVGSSGTLVFAPGETQKTLSVALIGDDTIESDESLTLDLLIPRGGDTHTLTIVNDDTAGVATTSIPTLNATGLLLLLGTIATLGTLQSQRRSA